MRETELTYYEDNPSNQIHALCAEAELDVRSECSLKTLPGSEHWHIIKPGTSGTLELTWFPKAQRFWVKVASNREASWIDEAIQMLQRKF